jgi:allophanate hydrolase
VYDDMVRMAGLKARAREALEAVDLLLVPTALEAYLVEEVAAEEGADPPSWPKNAKNGRFTNFVNLMGGLAGISVPSGLLRADYARGASADAPRAALLRRLGGPLEVALPFGVTLLAPEWHDDWLWGVGAAFVEAAGLGCGPEGHGVAVVRTGGRAANGGGAGAGAPEPALAAAK